MPLIQLIDAPVMTYWFRTHFKQLKSAFQACEKQGGVQMVFISDLDEEHVIGTSKKVMLWELVMTLKKWCCPSVSIFSILINNVL